MILREPCTVDMIGKKIQLVTKQPRLLEQLRQLPRQSYVRVAFRQEKELLLQSFEILNPNLEKNPVHLGKLREQSSLKGVGNLSIELLRAKVLRQIRHMFHQRGFIEHPFQVLLSGATEGGAQVFRVQGGHFLAQSPQLEKQLLVNSGISRVYGIGKAFRAEKFKTTRHHQEFTSIDFEMNTHVLTEVYEVALDVIRAAHRAAGVSLSEVQIARCSYQELLTKWGLDMLRRQDQVNVFEKFPGVRYLVVTGYPPEARAFYTRGRDNFDILSPKMQLCSGSLRISDPQVLCRRCHQVGVAPEGISKYIQSFREGAPVTGGAGIGFQRLMTCILGKNSIHEINPYYLSG